MKIAIIGSGLAGLSTCYHLLQSKGNTIDLFYDSSQKHGASFAATGLLHPYPGPFMRSYPYYKGLIDQSMQIVRHMETHFGKQIILNEKVLRPLIPTIESSKKKILRRYPHLEQMDSRSEALPYSLLKQPYFTLDHSYTLDTPLYLKLLFDWIQSNGVKCMDQQIDHIDSLRKEYDRIIVCTGGQTPNIKGLPPIPLTLIKGQALDIQTKSMDASVSIAGKGYFCPTSSSNIWKLGATYEKQFTDPSPDLNKAFELIVQKASIYLNYPLEKAQVVGVQSGLRAFLPTKRPVTCYLDPQLILCCGLGSKGLLYHGHLGYQTAHLVGLI